MLGIDLKIENKKSKLFVQKVKKCFDRDRQKRFVQKALSRVNCMAMG